MKYHTKRSPIHNFHVPLPEDLYLMLRTEAEYSNQSATGLAREAIESWLREKRRLELYESIASYATQHAGSDVDLSPELEAAGVEHLMDEDKS